VLDPVTNPNSSATPESVSKALFIHFLEDYLCIDFAGFQSGFDLMPDQILFHGPKLHAPNTITHGRPTTLSVPVSVMLLPQWQALQIIQGKRVAAECSLRRTA
jgi:hypothetical protein